MWKSGVIGTAIADVIRDGIDTHVYLVAQRLQQAR